MAEGKFNHLTNLCHLRSTTTDVVVSNAVSCLILITTDWLAFSVDKSLISESTVVTRGNLDNFEFNGSKVSLNGEGVALGKGTVSIFEVRGEVDRGQVSTKSFNAVSEGQNLYLLNVGQFGQWGHNNNVAKSDAEILTSALIHPNLIVVSSLVFGSEGNTDSLSTLLALEEDLVASHQVEFLHLLFGQLDDGVVVILRVFDGELVGGLLLGENGLGNIFLTAELG